MAAWAGRKSSSTIADATQMEEDLLHSIALVAGDNGPRRFRHPLIAVSTPRQSAIVADYPLQLLPPGDSRMVATAGYPDRELSGERCFFQDMIHSGINIYMTLELAQIYLRADDLTLQSTL